MVYRKIWISHSIFFTYIVFQGRQKYLESFLEIMQVSPLPIPFCEFSLDWEIPKDADSQYLSYFPAVILL
jgi:hypothetical protein